MPILLLTLLFGTLAYPWWKRTATTLTRNCRWREDRAAGEWACSYRNARLKADRSPTTCENPDR
jgi:hypothetical protein